MEIGTGVGQVSVELFFPLSRGVDRRCSGRLVVEERVEPKDTIRLLLWRLSQRHPKLQESVFDIRSEELRPIIVVMLNDRVLQGIPFLDTELHDRDRVSLLPAYVGG